MIVVVGSRDAQFPFMGPNKIIYHHEDDPDNVIYNEMCGYRFLLDNFHDFADDPYLGLEHYRRAFAYTDKELRDILSGYEIIVKEELPRGRPPHRALVPFKSLHRVA